MSEFSTLRDLSDPASLIAECDMMASVMRQQAESSRMGTAGAGHPSPLWLYNRVADIHEASAALLRKQFPPEPEKKPDSSVLPDPTKPTEPPLVKKKT